MADATNKVSYCPVELTLDLVASKWKPKLVRQLAGGGGRGGELRSRLPLATPKTLAQLLNDLEVDGLLERTLHSDDPGRVEYALTATGRRLAPLLERLADLGEDYAVEHGIEILGEEDAEELADEPAAESGRGPGRWLAWSWLPL